MKYLRYQKMNGGTLVEFSIVATVFFMVLFGVIEFGRLMFTWNVLDEVTRRGARLAAVCPVEDQTGIADRAILGNLLSGFGPENLLIEYLDGDSVPIEDLETNFIDIRYVRSSIINFQFQGFIPFINFIISAPDFRTILPSESLGIVPVGAGSVSC